MSGFDEHDFSVTNEQLLEGCRRQDQGSLRELFKRHKRPVYGLLYRMLSNHEDAEEALADVFLKVWNSARFFKGGCKFTTWLFTIAANTATDRLRSRKARKEVSIEDEVVDIISTMSTDASAESSENLTISREERRLILQALARLEYEDRLILTLHHFSERSLAEIAKITGIHAVTLKVKLFRARKRLREMCAKQDKDAGNDDVSESTTESTGLQQGRAECI